MRQRQAAAAQEASPRTKPIKPQFMLFGTCLRIVIALRPIGAGPEKYSSARAPRAGTAPPISQTRLGCPRRLADYELGRHCCRKVERHSRAEA